MDRTSTYKRHYLAVIGAAAVVSLAIIMYFDVHGIGVLLLALIFAAPTRIGYYFLHDLFRGRTLVDKHQPVEAIAATRRYLDTLDRQPWRQYFIHTFYSIYTWSTRAMALNNLGAAKIELGQFDEAAACLAQAIALDEAYPIPYWNLAIIAAVQEDHAQSNRLRLKAEQLGYRHDSIDQAITRVAAIYARIQ